MSCPKRFIVGITGASGACYGVHLTRTLLENNYEVHLVVSASGWIVLQTEMGICGKEDLKTAVGETAEKRLFLHDVQDIAAPIASGSFKTAGMIISPCSMGTLAAVSQGMAQNLITRAADVCLKENRPLVLVVRETPLNAIHLENMLKLSRLGVTILPAMPAFYQHPETIEDLVKFITGRTLDRFDIDLTLYPRYGEDRE